MYKIYSMLDEDKCNREKKQEGKQGVGIAVLNMMGKKSLSEKLTFEQRC